MVLRRPVLRRPVRRVRLRVLVRRAVLRRRSAPPGRAPRPRGIPLKGFRRSREVPVLERGRRAKRRTSIVVQEHRKNDPRAREVALLSGLSGAGAGEAQWARAGQAAVWVCAQFDPPWPSIPVNGPHGVSSSHTWIIGGVAPRNSPRGRHLPATYRPTTLPAS